MQNRYSDFFVLISGIQTSSVYLVSFHGNWVIPSSFHLEMWNRLFFSKQMNVYGKQYKTCSKCLMTFPVLVFSWHHIVIVFLGLCNLFVTTDRFFPNACSWELLVWSGVICERFGVILEFKNAESQSFIKYLVKFVNVQTPELCLIFEHLKF